MSYTFKERNSKKQRLCIAQVNTGKQCIKPATIHQKDNLYIVMPYCADHDEDFAYEYKICKQQNCSVWIHHDLNATQITKDFCFIHGGNAILYMGGSYKRALSFIKYQNENKCLFKCKNGRRCGSAPELTTDCILLPYCAKHNEALNPTQMFTLCKNEHCKQWVYASAKKSAYCYDHGGENYLQGSFEKTLKQMYPSAPLVQKPKNLKKE